MNPFVERKVYFSKVFIQRLWQLAIAVTKMKGTKICLKSAVNALNKLKPHFSKTFTADFEQLLFRVLLQRLCQLGDNNRYIAVTKTQRTKSLFENSSKKFRTNSNEIVLKSLLLSLNNFFQNFISKTLLPGK